MSLVGLWVWSHFEHWAIDLHESYWKHGSYKNDYFKLTFSVFKISAGLRTLTGKDLGRSDKLSFFIIYKFWLNCASVRQVSDLILKSDFFLRSSYDDKKLQIFIYATQLKSSYGASFLSCVAQPINGDGNEICTQAWHPELNLRLWLSVPWSPSMFNE